jgi:GNAT superfamily N-acetyltransferase
MSAESEIARLEELALNAWPAEVTQSVEGWRLRFTDGVSRRANSVWSNQPTGTRALAERIAGAEDFYRPRNTDACFHVGPLSPAQLDGVLATRGYHRNGDTQVQRVDLETLLSSIPTAKQGVAIELQPAPSEAWERIAWPSAELRPEVRRGILSRIGPQKICALAVEAGRPVAVGLAVAERGHVGIFSMQTTDSARGRGHAGSVLRGLAAWGASLGAQLAYLQVEADNASAKRLYTRAGFRTLYGYHYRSLGL